MASNTRAARAAVLFAAYVAGGDASHGYTLEDFATDLNAARVEISIGTLKRYSTDFGWQERDEALPCDLAVVIPPHRPPGVITESTLSGPNGWIPVDRGTLRTHVENVYAIGDVSVIPLENAMNLPKAGIYAHGQAEVVAKNIARRSRHSAMRSQAMTAGRAGASNLSVMSWTAPSSHSSSSQATLIVSGSAAAASVAAVRARAVDDRRFAGPFSSSRSSSLSRARDPRRYGDLCPVA